MNSAARNMNGAAVARCVIAFAVAAAAFVAIAAAQRYQEGGYALDANLQVGSRGLNPATGARNFIQRDIYRVNRATGDIEYVERNAFAAPSYRTGPAFGQVVNDPLNSAFRRPTQPPTGQGGDPFVLDRSTGTIRYDFTEAFQQPRYNPRGTQTRQPVTPGPRPNDPLYVRMEQVRQPTPSASPPSASGADATSASRRASLRASRRPTLEAQKYDPLRERGSTLSPGYRPGSK